MDAVTTLNVFESNVNYDLGKTMLKYNQQDVVFESNVNYDLGKTVGLTGRSGKRLRAM